MLTDNATENRTPLLLARKRANLTQLQLAGRAGCSIQTISIGERTGHLTVRMAEKLARALDVSPQDLRQWRSR